MNDTVTITGLEALVTAEAEPQRLEITLACGDRRFQTVITRGSSGWARWP
jgi:hypothetical protein